jgi:arylsulfatase A-like enzyme
MYDPKSLPLGENSLPEHPFDNGEMQVRDELLAAYPRDPHEVRRHLAAYYGMITHLDAQIGRVLAALRETGQLDDTIIVLAGDNGLALGRHGLMGKQSLYEHSIHVPLVICGPGIAAGQRSEALVYLLDIFPTLCDLLGLAAPGSVERAGCR